MLKKSKKLWFLVLVLVLALALAALAASVSVPALSGVSPSPDAAAEVCGVSMTLVAGGTDADGITVCIENTADSTVHFGEDDYALEYCLLGKWYRVTPRKNATFELCGIMLRGIGQTELTFCPSEIYASLPRGKYRIVKEFCFPTKYTDETTGEAFALYEDPFYLCCEFVIE
ncbi:MAG: hypothetical protein IJ449_00700 [Clostridia bacterium]|nr:hypothetical protein [Clostridia bacterium]